MAHDPGTAAPKDGPAAEGRVGRVLQERYRITGRIAAGGMGVVYRGERIGLGRVVAIKFLHATMARDPQIQRRFEIEAQAMSRLSHPNCVGVLDFGVDDLPYVVIDYVEGVALDVLVEKGPVPARRAVRIVRQILAGLAHAHKQGIVHRDIKPDNVLLEGGAGLEDHVRILDFGLAKLMGSDFGLTAGLAVGTPNYMAPEQMSETPVDARADQYATGIVLFELLTGQRPYNGHELGEIFMQHLGAPIPKLREVMPAGHFSAALEAIVTRAMAKRPDDRFASAEAMAQALDQVPEAHGTPGPESVRGAIEPRPMDPAVDATVPWSSSRLALPVPAAGAAVAASPAGWQRWFFARPFRLAVASGLGSALLAVAMVSIGFSGRPQPAPAAPTATVVFKPGAAAPAARPTAAAKPVRAAAPIEAKTRPERARTVAAAPRTASEAMAAGQKAFTEGRYAAGLEAFRQAVKREPRRRGDAALLGPVITSLDSDKRGERAAFLSELGEPAVPHLRAAAKNHPNPKVRARAAELLPAPAPPKRKPFLRWL